LEREDKNIKEMNPPMSQMAADLKGHQACSITSIEEYHLLSYLKATGLERGLLLNFGRPRLEFKRFVYTHLRESAQSAD
jgi:hypothetical protein